MANEEQLAILHQGVEVWNKWREENPTAEIDLTDTDLSNFDLSRANLNGANLFVSVLRDTDLGEARLRDANLEKAILTGAILKKSDLIRADLNGAYLNRANFSEADLREANFREAFLSKANFYGAHLNSADLTKADLRGAYLLGADLRGASLIGAHLMVAVLVSANLSNANLSGTILVGANFNKAKFGQTNLKGAMLEDTIFGRNDLSEAICLEEVVHKGPSSIDTHTIHLSKGKIPEVFLRGCGLSDADIEYSRLINPDFANEDVIKIQGRIYDLRTTQAFQIYPLFISYSHTDKDFVDQLDSALTKKGVRFWRDIHDAVAGRLETQIDRAIRQNTTVLLVLSKNSIKSDWVEHEVRKARELEKELGRDALCPIALDDGWKSSPWPKRVMEQVMEYNILDFSDWEDESAFDGKFAKLLNGLDLFYKKAGG